MFRSFYSAGFECSTGRNRHREWIDQVAATEHEQRVGEDYDLLGNVGIHTVREGVRWPLVDRGHSYDFSSLMPFIHAARKRRTEVIWDLFHYGYPEALDPFGAAFPESFARYARAVAQRICDELPGPHYFTPVNEGSYFAWAAGEVGLFGPHATGRGHELKICMARAALLAVDAIRGVCRTARFVTVDPLCHVVLPPSAGAEELERAEEFNRDVVFQFLDMLAGRALPELGGARDCVDIIGLNYYASNQWALGQAEVALASHDPRRIPLATLVRGVIARYGGPVLISETAETGDARAGWIDQLSETALELLAAGEPLVGICLYPVLGMPEWHDREQWARMGLWDLAAGPQGLERQPVCAALRALARASIAIENFQASRVTLPRARSA